MHVRCGNRIMSRGIPTLVPKNTAKRSSGLGNGESPKLNLASLLEAPVHKKPIKMNTGARSILSCGETHTSRTLITTALKLRGALGGNR